ncbi:MAG: undecaprenyl/decaprenyl-phosphate alpha-N-acetylglucosaminyl 1-phosphate transferase [Planctomycetes bacterium]|nr:undecaprenyl/decaprenyl-phosphate alpha-N-acetylglucosaminyl 1-phosphate transferase [Planctomycetota bacterium]
MTGYWSYLAAFGAALAVSWLATPLVIRLAWARGFIDRPGGRKVHSSPVPRIGGAVFALAMMVVAMPMLFLSDRTHQQAVASQTQLLALMGLSLLMFLVGLVDDIRGLRARTKLIFQLIAALGICWAGIRIEIVGIGGIAKADIGWLSWPATVIWIVVITNAVNLIDGLDGLAAGIAAITCAVLAVFSFATGQVIMAMMMLVMLGSLLGFLCFNFNPARIFMGDCGTLFLGFFLAAASVQSTTKSQTIVALALPALSLGLPIFDAAFSILRRFLERRSIFSPDRSHIHHRLLDMGLRQRHAVIVLYVVTLLAGGLGLFMLVMNHFGILSIFLGVCLMLLIVFRVAGAVRFGQIFGRLLGNWRLGRQSRASQQRLQRLQAALKRCGNLAQWWRCTRLAAMELGFAGLKVRAQNPGRAEQTLHWQAGPNLRTDPPTGEVPPRAAAPASIKFLAHLRADDTNLEIELLAPVGGSIESVGRRLAIFGQLIDERGRIQMEDGAIIREMSMLQSALEHTAPGQKANIDLPEN